MDEARDYPVNHFCLSEKPFYKNKKVEYVHHHDFGSSYSDSTRSISQIRSVWVHPFNIFDRGMIHLDHSNDQFHAFKLSGLIADDQIR